MDSPAINIKIGNVFFFMANTCSLLKFVLLQNKPLHRKKSNQSALQNEVMLLNILMFFTLTIIYIYISSPSSLVLQIKLLNRLIVFGRILQIASQNRQQIKKPAFRRVRKTELRLSIFARNGIYNIFCIRACNVFTRYAFKTAEKRVGIDFAHQKTFLPE